MRRAATAILVLLTLSNAAHASGQPQLPANAEPNLYRELRLGLVCYGGISLAIYMYGQTREIYNLTVASAALECDAGNRDTCGVLTPGAAWATLTPSQQFDYSALLNLWRADKDHVRTRVVVDVISGTSAGGLNGVVLAKALSNDKSIDEFRRLWFDEADIRRLAGRPVLVRSLWRLTHNRAALQGDTWLKQLYVALEDMDKSTKPLPHLVPSGAGLDLLVTATDFYGTDRLLEIGDPASAWETRHDHVFHFSFDPTKRNESGMTEKSNVALAFAGRSSASFPVAFPAIRLQDVPDALGTHVDTSDLAGRLFADRLAEHPPGGKEGLAQNLFLVDGGVLNNHPFNLAFARIAQKTPAREVRRVFIYLEPDPRITGPSTDGNNSPGVVSMFWNAETSIPGSQPIAGDLRDIHRHNEAVDRISSIIRSDENRDRSETTGVGQLQSSPSSETPTVAGRVYGRLQASKVPQQERTSEDPGDRRAIIDLRDDIERDAASRSPLAEEAYTRLRTQSVLAQLSHVTATSICRISDTYEGLRTSLIRSLIYEWAARNHLIDDPTPPATDLTRGAMNVDPEARRLFLAGFDLGYLRRRMRFVSEWLNEQYDPAHYHAPDYHLHRDQVFAARQAITADINRMSDYMDGRNVSDLNIGNALAEAYPVLCQDVNTNKTPDEQAREILDNPDSARKLGSFASAMENALGAAQEQALSSLYRQFDAQTSTWPEDARRAVLARYLGFPYWDRVSYPYVAFSGLGDMTPITITRFSPADTLSVSKKGAGKLGGSTRGHFGAFLQRPSRERDYLWGRLDAGERMLSLIGIDSAEQRDAMRRTILDEEKMSPSFKTDAVKFIEQCVAGAPDKC